MDQRLADLPPSLRYAVMAVVGLAIMLFAVGAIATAGGGDGPSDAEPTSTPPVEQAASVLTATSTPAPTPTATPTPPPPTPTPEITPEPTPAPPPPPPPFEPTEAYVAITATTYAGPSANTAPVRQLYQGARVNLVGMVSGQNWIIGDQDWVPVEQSWERTWYRLDDGSYIYRAFVYFPDGESPFGSGDRYVVVDINAQTAWAMDGSRVVRELPITSGKPGFETPTGNFNVIARVANERMTSERAGITGVAEQYDVYRVLFTQYFADGGFALHLNYWQPMGVYGGYPTSHGCVGIPLADAQFLWLFGSPGMRVIVRNGGGATPAPAPPPPPPAATAAATPAPTPTPTPAATATPTAVATPTASAAPTKTATASARP